MIVRVLFFAALREKAGVSEVMTEIPEGASAHDLLESVALRFPAVRPAVPVIRMAVNEAYADSSVTLKEGDEVALITPVSGG